MYWQKPQAKLTKTLTLRRIEKCPLGASVEGR
jgi:hypothetical protein